MAYGKYEYSMVRRRVQQHSEWNSQFSRPKPAVHNGCNKRRLNGSVAFTNQHAAARQKHNDLFYYLSESGGALLQDNYKLRCIANGLLL